MREIDSAHDNSEARLRQALRSLSSSSPSGAPSGIGDALAHAFRRHHARRRAVRRASVAAAIFAVLVPAAVWLMRSHRAQPPVAKAPPPASVAPPVVPAPVPLPNASSSPSRIKKPRSMQARRMVIDPLDDFVTLPSSDQAVRGEDLRVIRLEVTGRSLRIVGAPVSQEMEDQRLLADFVVGQDGTPYAVRLVR